MNIIKKSILLVITFILMVGMLAPTSSLVKPKLTNVHPQLIELAAEHPDQVVKVIVQKADGSDRAELLVEKLGGQVTKTLKLINAFVAQLPAKQVPEFATMASVNWVYLDARMLPAAQLELASDYTLRDVFKNQAYNGSDGTINWPGDWHEEGESDGPNSGRVRVVSNLNCADSNCLRIGAEGVRLNNHGVTRAVDLHGAVTATLSFSYLRKIEKGGGNLTPSISNDGGTTWINLDGISLWFARDRSRIYENYDLTPNLGSEMLIRFTVYSKDEFTGYVYLDDVNIDYTIQKNTFLETLGIDQLQNEGFSGQGISVAVIDSGIDAHADLSGRLVDAQLFGDGDTYGHGTHVAGISGGDGSASDGHYAGIAPGINLISLGVSDENGMAYESDVVGALEWVFDHKDQYNIRVVNLSLNSTIEDSYHNSGIDAAMEILWFNNIVVVASVGNKGPAGGYNTASTAPANDPFIIAVGASDEKNSSQYSDDTIAPFSAHGKTIDGFVRPDIIAPGYNIISLLAPSSPWSQTYPERVGFAGQYFRISGTSMAAPMVTGAIALLLQDEPELTPNQVKYRLINTGSMIGGYPYLRAYDAVHGMTTESSNQGIVPHMLLAKMAMIAYWASENGGEDIDWGNVDWDSVNWNAVNWNAVNWNAVNWNAVNWNAVNWNAVNWNAVNWNAVNWNSVNWNAVNWNAVNWNAVNWNATGLDGIFWGKGRDK
jgi:serine protease AprX